MTTLRYLRGDIDIIRDKGPYLDLLLMICQGTNSLAISRVKPKSQSEFIGIYNTVSRYSYKVIQLLLDGLSRAFAFGIRSGDGMRL